MLFILNGKMEVVDTLSNDGDLSEITPFFDDEYKQYLSTGTDTFTFSTMANTRESEHLVVGNYIAFMYKDKERLFHITEIEETHDKEFTKTVYCETAGIELINEIIRPMAMNSVSLTRFLSSVLSETEWEVGFVDASLTDVHDININNYPSVYSTLQEHVVGTYGGEISFTCKLQGGRLSKKYVNVYARRGNVNGYRFEYSSNISSITKKSDSSNLVTALIGKGKDGLTFASIETPDKPKNQDFIADEDAYKRWNLNGSHIMGVFECDTESKQELLKLTREELKKRKNPQVSYELKTEMLGDDIEIGDTVRVADHEFNPPIQLEARVNELTISFTDQSKNECVLSNFVEISSNITGEMKKIASKLEGYIDNKFPISGDKIQDGAVSGDKISQDYTDKVVSDSVNASKVITNELIANKANIGDLNATNATIGNLKVDVAKINTLLAGNITADNIQAGTITADKIAAGTITAGSGIIADGAIGSAQISKLDAGKITSGTVDTSKVTVAGSNSHLRIKGNRLQVFQGLGNQAKERVSLGDVNGDGTVYGLRVRGADGKTVLLDENGVKSEGITNGAITNDKISDNAEIDGAKLNINSVVSKINEEGTETINGTKIEVDGQTLNTKLSTITIKQNEDGEKITQAQSQITANTNALGLKVDNQTYQTDKKNMTSKMNKNTSAIDVLQGQIALKVEQTDIKTAIDNITIGSRNLAIGTKTPLTISYFTGADNYCSNPYTIHHIRECKVGDVLTISYEFEYTNLTRATDGILYLHGWGDVTGWSGAVNVNDNISSDSIVWGSAEKKVLKVVSNMTVNATTLKDEFLYIRMRTDKITGGSFSIKNFKIEKGNKATDWTPAPEDLDSEINTAKAEIKVTTDKISQSVSNLSNTVNTKADGTTVANLNNKVGSLETSVNGITGKVSSLEKTTTTLGTQVTNAQGTADSAVSKVNSAVSKADKAQSTANGNKTNITNLQGEVSTIKNDVASLEVTTSGISQKVSSVESTTTTLKADLTNTTKKVNGALEKVENAQGTANNALNKANSAQSTANTNKNNIATMQTTVNNTSNKVASLETNLNSITSRVSATESTTTTLNNKIDGIQIGGRNLISGTKTSKTLVTNHPDSFLATDIYKSPNGATFGDLGMKVGDDVTVSYDWSITQNGSNAFKYGKFFSELSLNGSYKERAGSTTITTSSSNRKGRFVSTFKATANIIASNSLRVRIDNSCFNLIISNAKLTISSKDTGWSPAPEDVTNDISTVDGKVNTANNNISSLTNRVSSAESKLTKDSLTTTIGSHYTTSNDVNGIVSSKGYQTQSQVQQTVNSLQAKFTSSGGYNLLRNGCAKNGTAYWSNNGGGISVGTAGSGNGLGEGATYFSSSFPSGITGEWVTLKPNTDYIYSAKLWSASSFTGSTTTPLHFWCSSTKVSGNTQLTVIDYKSECKANEWNDVYVHFRTKGGTVYFKPFVYLGGTTSINFSVSEIMLCEGVIKCPYSPHPSEVYDGITTIDKDGINVIASNVKSKTSMSANGFRITKTDTNEDVFKVGSDGKLIMTGDIQGSTFSSTSGDFKVLDDGTVDATSLSVEDEVSTDTLNVEYISNTKYQAVIDRNYEVHINPWYEWESEGLEHGGHYKSLSSFIDACPRNLNGYNITVNIWSDLTESVNFNMFNNGILTLQLNECTIYGYIVCNNHSMRYRIYGNNSSSTGSKLGSIMPNTGFSATGGYYSLMGSYTHLTVYDMKLYGGKASGNNNGLCITNLSKCYANNVQFVGCYSGIRSYSVSNTYVSSSSGLTTNVAFYAGSGSTIALNNTNQAGRSGSTNHTGTANNGQVLSSGATFSSSAVSGSNTTTSTPTVTKTATITANYGDTYRKTVYNNWKRDGSVRQGEWNNYGDCVGAWFFGEKISSYSDKNITGVSITIKRQAGGSSSAVTHTLKMHDHETRPSGSPTFRSDFSKDFSVATNKSTTINLSSSEIATFKKCKGLGLVPKAYNSTYYSVCSGSITVKITYKE